MIGSPRDGMAVPLLDHGRTFLDVGRTLSSRPVGGPHSMSGELGRSRAAAAATRNTRG